MKKRSLCRRVISLLLAAATMLSLCACGKEEDTGSRAVYDPAADTVIEDHVRHNRSLNTEIATDRQAEEFHFYVTNTETMTGFVGGQVTAYQDSVTSVFNAAYDCQFGKYYSHSMNRQGSSGLYWGEAEELNDQILNRVLSTDFYEGNVLPAAGAVPALFRSESGPFQKNAMTVLVSNFVEPNFDLTSLSMGIEKYFSDYERSAACVIGFSSQFRGNFHVPSTGNKDRSTVSLMDFTGKVPCYMVVVGPEGDVMQYTEKLFEYLERRNVTYSYEHYSNSLYEQVFAEPLTFDVIEDPKMSKAPTSTELSYNTGNMTEHESGYAYFATYTGVETRDGNTSDRKSVKDRTTAKDRKASRGETTEATGAPETTAAAGEETVKISKSTQIALLSRNYDGVSRYALAEPVLYIYDQETKQWKDAGKNAQKAVSVFMEPKTGLSETHLGETYIALTDDREEMYVAAKLDFETDGLLTRDQLYRLELKILMEQDATAGENSTSANGSGLQDYSITAAEYYQFIDDLEENKKWADELHNYQWTALADMNPADKQIKMKAQKLMAHTPGLDALLISLRDLEDNYKTDIEMHFYLDFVFNIPDREKRK